MTPEELRNSILQRAFTGKLSTQYKHECVEESKIDKKKNKDMKYFDFELSDNWVLSTIEGISRTVPSKKYQIKQSEVLSNGKYPVVSQSNEFITGYYNDIDKVYKNKESVVIFGDHTTVVKYVDFDFVVGADGVKIFEPISIVDAKYLFYCLLFMTIGLDKVGRYSRHYKFIKNKALPIPPLAEQKRIVDKIEELMPLIDDYEKNWQRLEELDKKFPEDMKKSLLQEAIKGKLVEQRAEEGTGEELYKLIQEEKKKLIKEGKIKKQKALDEIKEEEIPFDIPKNWKWVRLGEIGEWAAGSTPSRTNLKFYGGNIPWLKTGDLNDGYIIDVPECITDLALEKTSLKLNPAESVLIAMYGATIGKLGILTKPMTTNQACCACQPFNGIYNLYLFYFLMASRSRLTKMAEGGAQPNISRTKIISVTFPLPPLAEQKLIVEKLEELLPLCDELIKKEE